MVSILPSRFLVWILAVTPILVADANAPGAIPESADSVIASCLSPVEKADISDIFVKTPISGIVGSGAIVAQSAGSAPKTSVSHSGASMPSKETKQRKMSVKTGFAKKPTEPSDAVLMSKVCKYGKSHGRVTELCNNWKMFNRFKEISTSRGVPFSLQLWIALRESHLWTNFKSTDPTKDDYVCSATNNWAWLKKRVLDSGKGTRDVKNADGTTRKVSFPDDSGCWLYPFDSPEDFWTSFANTLKYGYIRKGLDTPSEIAPIYVGRSDAESSKWVGTVSKMYAVE